MIKELIGEYLHFYKRKKMILIHAIVCYYRVPKFRIVVLVRCLQNATIKLVRKHYQKKLKIKYGVDIGIDSCIGEHLWLEHYTGLVIGNGVKIGKSCTLYHGITLGQRNGKYPYIGDNVTIYPGAIVLGNINVGHDSIILAGSVVLSDVPDYAIVGGNPASLKKQQNSLSLENKKEGKF